MESLHHLSLETSNAWSILERKGERNDRSTKRLLMRESREAWSLKKKKPLTDLTRGGCNGS